MPGEPLQPRVQLHEPARSDPNEPPREGQQALLLAALRACLPADTIVSHEAELRPYECDGLTAFRQIPLAVILPRTEQQVGQALAV
ncbi:MAG TPA: hypothetical protein VEY89_13050, partial [Candidatus Dormibacteraeota bacterium]|nr:hypothetical protein [Candidatus Dormibacteraeota bacterium]